MWSLPLVCQSTCPDGSGPSEEVCSASPGTAVAASGRRRCFQQLGAVCHQCVSEQGDVTSCDVCLDICKEVAPTHLIDLHSVRMSDVGYIVWRRNSLEQVSRSLLSPTRAGEMHLCLNVQVHSGSKYHHLPRCSLIMSPLPSTVS